MLKTSFSIINFTCIQCREVLKQENTHHRTWTNFQEGRVMVCCCLPSAKHFPRIWHSVSHNITTDRWSDGIIINYHFKKHNSLLQHPSVWLICEFTNLQVGSPGNPQVGCTGVSVSYPVIIQSVSHIIALKRPKLYCILSALAWPLGFGDGRYG